jgi:hypothetical protein
VSPTMRTRADPGSLALPGIAFKWPDRLRPGQGAQNSGASVTFSPSSSAVNGIWQDRREFSCTW